MKLLDFETGKDDFELGKDWLYGGDIIIINTCKIGYSIYEAIKHKDSEKFYKYDKDCPFTNELNQSIETLCEKIWAVVYGGRYVLFNQEQGDVFDVDYYGFDMSSISYNKELSLNGIILKDNFVIGKNSCKCYEVENIIEATYFEGMENIRTDNKYGFIDNNYNAKYIIYFPKTNIFKEYSKQLRNEPNKFEEFMELIK